MRDHPAGEQMQERMRSLLSVLNAPDDDLVRQFEARLAVVALILGSVPLPLGPEVTDEQRAAVALEVAT